MDFRIPFRACGFGEHVPHSGSITLTESGLAHALFTTGRAPVDQWSHGASSLWEFVHRASIVQAYLRSYNGALTRSSLALNLDRSEKVGLSYLLGQAMAGVFCNQILAVPHTMHVDRYGRRNGIAYWPTQQRPDLFGRSHLVNGWVVVEAKGRSNAADRAVIENARQQKRAIRTINGQPPAIPMACVASFPPKSAGLRIDAFDPDDELEEAVDIEVDLDRYLLAYYAPFAVALDRGAPADVDADGISAVSFPNIRVTIGLRERIFGLLRGAMSGDIEGFSGRVFTELATTDEGHRRFSDGSYFDVDWAEALTIDDWEYEV